MSEVRIAVVGAGLIGRSHAQLIQESDSCELSAIVDPAPGAGDFAREAGVPIYPTLADLFATERPDGMIVATPNSLHVENGLDCVKHGVPMLVEKPIADSVEESVRLVEAAEAAGVPLLVGHHRRHSPILAKARGIVGDGTLGPTVAVMGSALFYKPDQYFDEGPWRREVGGGPILINMIHEVDDLRWLCGDIVTVQAFSSSATRGFPVEDTVAVNLCFANGALGTFLLSDTAASARSWEQTSQENASYAHYPNEDCYLIAGARGSLAVPTMRLKAYTGERSWWEPFQEDVVHVDRADPLARQLEHFCSVIRGEVQPLVSGREGLQTLRVTLAIHEAAQTERPVHLPLTENTAVTTDKEVGSSEVCR
jgi:predicted dehydrogenase